MKIKRAVFLLAKMNPKRFGIKVFPGFSRFIQLIFPHKHTSTDKSDENGKTQKAYHNQIRDG
jgi:hypothetical protein